MKKITDFLSTRTARADLATALAVIREFKACESKEEWMSLGFVAWAKLEQLEEFLSHIVDGTPLAKDTVAYMKGGE